MVALDPIALGAARKAFAKGPPGVVRRVQHVDSYPGERVAPDDPPDPAAYQPLPTTIAEENRAIEDMVRAYLTAAAPAMTARLAGHCPGCGGSTLFVGDGGHITCSLLDCPDPTAVDRILDDRETEHVVLIEQSSFNLQHPLRERGEDLFACDMHARLSALAGPPVRPGRYRVVADGGGGFHWTEVER